MLKTTNNSKVCFGYTNLASHGFYLPFFDYDIKDFSTVYEELLFIQKKFMLSNIYVYYSENGFNALSLDKLPFNILKEMYTYCNLVCKDYMELGLKRDFLALRIGKDKKLCHTLKTETVYYKKSLVHALLLIEFFDTPIERDNTFDSNTVLRLKAYRSNKHGIMEVSDVKK